MPTKRHFHKRNLPHLYYDEGIYFVTFRLYNSIHPVELLKLQKFRSERTETDRPKIFKKYDELLDKPNNNINYLIIPAIAEICKNSTMRFDGKEIEVICYCIMPNHIHLVFELLDKEKLVGDIIASIKKYSARLANKVLSKTGKFWQAESFDRLVRDEKELYNIIKYVLLNPVTAGLVEDYKDWQHTYCKKEYMVL